MSAVEGTPFVDRRATRAVIDLDAFANNVRLVRSRLAPRVDLMAVVKANAYGHGARLIARTAIEAGASDLGVATVSEGVQLRRFGITAPILILGSITSEEAELALRFDLTVTIADDLALAAVARAARGIGGTQPAAIQLKVDSGMRRFGASPEQALALAATIAADPHLSLSGIFSHFASADDPMATSTREQGERFRALLNEMTERRLTPHRIHIANSAAMLTATDRHENLVRSGIALYGLQPSPRVPLFSGMRPVMGLRSQVARVFSLAAGDAVGYGGTYRAETAGRAALIPIGYADGYRRGLSNRGWMAADGWRLPVIGRVSMDQTIVAIPPEASLTVGSGVSVMATDPDDLAPTADTIADLLETISYEIVAGISARVPRHFMRGGNVVAIESIETGLVEFS